MNIQFIQALSMEGIDIERVYPIGLVTLASIIKRESDHHLNLFDMNISDDPYGQLKEQLTNFSADLICISLRNIDPLGNKTSSLIPSFAVTLAFIKKICPDVKIMAGGTGFTLFAKQLLREYPEIDFGIVGEAENNIIPLLQNLNSPPDLPGICYRNEGQIIINPPVGDFDMQNYKVPDRDLLDPHAYLERNHYVECMGVETKRGCNFTCGYCAYPTLSGAKLRCRNPIDVVDEIEYLKKHYGIFQIHFTDSVVNTPVDHFNAVCQELLNRNLDIHWSGFFRENLLTEENVRLYADSGCQCFSLSPDGLTQDCLNQLNKHMQVEDILKAARILAKCGVVTVYHFLVNTPGATFETVAEAKELIDQLSTIHKSSKTLGTIVLNNIRILPGTAIEQQALEQKVIDTNTDLLYPTYFNPRPFDKLRYELEIYHQKKNIFTWQEV
ncbi:B12 lower ligand biosynthesis radical SAM protein BzaD [Eubacteriaceae bacterium ES3]|nr:B12 lower ligand biosynthesis radical SAM protein BzaD [Eubacteriaceae bacterium ES3]